jgi:hypothetical protein
MRIGVATKTGGILQLSGAEVAQSTSRDQNEATAWIPDTVSFGEGDILSENITYANDGTILSDVSAADINESSETIVELDSKAGAISENTSEYTVYKYATYIREGDAVLMRRGGSVSSNSINQTDTSDTELSNEEKWESIISQYNSSKMTFGNYNAMLFELAAVGLISSEEHLAASLHVLSIVGGEVTAIDIKNGILGDLGLSYFDYPVNISELLRCATDKNNNFGGYLPIVGERRDFLVEFYSKLGERVSTNYSSIDSNAISMSDVISNYSRDAFGEYDQEEFISLEFEKMMADD